VTGFDLGLLAALLFAGAALYASVGQAGATAFIAAMGAVGMPAATMRPTALALNILAAAFSTWRFHGAGHIEWRVLSRFALAAVPCAFIGGAVALPDSIYKPVVGVVLLIAALLLFRRVFAKAPAFVSVTPPSMPLASLVGGLIGLLSGLTATGGGVYLSPLLILFGWTTPRQAAGVASPFILLNSAAGLLGAILGIKYLPASSILLVLGVVLTISGAQLVLR
jgi:uncharacterized membrane protein YfcA